jgi:hypothetical protein
MTDKAFFFLDVPRYPKRHHLWWKVAKLGTLILLLTFRHPIFTFKFQHTLYVKCE